MSDDHCSPSYVSGDTGTAGKLDVGETWTFSCTYAITQADIDAGSVSNTASAAADGPQGDPGDTADDATDTDSTTVPVPQVVTIDLEKSGTLDMTVAGSATRADPGDRIDYLFDITNTGNVTLHDVALSDATVVESCGTFDGTLDPGEHVQCFGTVTLAQTDIDTGFVDNTADVTATGPQDQAATDQDTFSVTVPQVVTISIDKVATLHQDVVAPNDRVDAGDTISYAFTVTDTGNVTLHDVVVTDPLTGTDCTIGTLTPGAVDSTCSATYTLLQSDVDAGHRANTATVNATGPQPLQTTSDTDTEDVALPATGAISVDKAGSLDIASTAPTTRAKPRRPHQLHVRRHQRRQRDPARRHGRRPVRRGHLSAGDRAALAG